MIKINSNKMTTNEYLNNIANNINKIGYDFDAEYIKKLSSDSRRKYIMNSIVQEAKKGGNCTKVNPSMLDDSMRDELLEKGFKVEKLVNSIDISWF